MRLLVLGQSGQVARELAGLVGVDVTCLARAEADLSTQKGQTAAAARIRQGWDGVINAAAYTAVDKAEEDEASAYTLNATAPGVLARAAAQGGSPFVHISTDYVFAGDGASPWRECDATAPMNAYGRTKRAGEIAVQEAGGPHAILRTSWVFSAHGANFVKTMLRLAKARDSLTVVGDQIGGPTSAAYIALACVAVVRGLQARSDASGIYHFAGAPDTSWAGFAREIFRQSGNTTQVTDIPTADYPTPARRPLNSRLDCRAIQAAFGVARPDWRVDLGQVLKELGDIA